jgi:capsular exopolysaccharide synthesis family protein
MGQALNNAAQLQSSSVMQYVLGYDHTLQQRGYTANDLLVDVVPSTSTTAATISLLATAKHPADAVLLANDVANGFAAYITAGVQQQLNTKISDLKTQITAQQQQKASWEAKLEALPNNTVPQYAVYNNNLADTTHTIDALQAQLQVLPTTVKGDVFVIQLATLKDVTSSIRGYIILGVTAGVGLLIGFLIMLLMIYLDNRLKSAEQVKEKLGLAYLGGLSHSRQIGDAPLTVRGDELHDVSDICANLRLTGVLSRTWRAPQGVILLITSPKAAEGKSTLAAMLGATIARGGNSVLVIDGNLRRPSTHLTFKLKNAGIGLSGLLRGMGSEGVRDAIVRSSVPGLWLLPAGPAMDDATLLLEQRLPGLLAQVSRDVDVVVIDGPSLLSGADASLLASMSDGIALVIDARHEKLPLLLRTKELLNSLTHIPVGIVMNHLATGRDNRYYASAYPVDAPADPWIPIEAHVSNRAALESGRGTWSLNGSQRIVSAPIAAIPARLQNAPLLPNPSGAPIFPGPTGMFTPNTSMPPYSLAGAAQPANGQGIPMAQQYVPLPTGQPPSPGEMNAAPQQQPGTGR